MSSGVWTDLTGTMGQCGCASDIRDGRPNINPAAMRGTCLGERMVNVWFPSGPGTMAQCASGDMTNATILPVAAQCTAPSPDEHGCSTCNAGATINPCSRKCGLHYMQSCVGAADFGRPTTTYYADATCAVLAAPVVTPMVSYMDGRHSCYAPCQPSAVPEHIETPICSGNVDGAGAACELNTAGDACAVDGGDCWVSSTWVPNPDYVPAEPYENCLSRVETPMSSGSWVESGYCMGAADEPEMVSTHDERHTCRAGCSHAAGTWDSCQVACDTVGPEQAPDIVYGAIDSVHCFMPPEHIETPMSSGNWVPNPDFIQCSDHTTDSAATWLAADAAAVCAARPGCALKPGPTIDDSAGPSCQPGCSSPEIVDSCVCARDDVAEPFTTCSLNGGCGACSPEECSFAPGCTEDTAAGGCVCGTGRYLKDVCSGGIVMTEIYDDPAMCGAAVGAPLGAVVKDGGRQTDDPSPVYTCTSTTQGGSKSLSCDGLADGDAAMLAYYTDSGCSAASFTHHTRPPPAVRFFECGCMPSEGLVNDWRQVYSPQFDCPSQEWYTNGCVSGALNAPIFTDAFCTAAGNGYMPPLEVTIFAGRLPYGECLNFHHPGIGDASGVSMKFTILEHELHHLWSILG